MRRPAVRLNSGVHVFLGTAHGPGNREHISLNGRQPVARDTNDDDVAMTDEDLVSQISPFAELPTEVSDNCKLRTRVPNSQYINSPKHFSILHESNRFGSSSWPGQDLKPLPPLRPARAHFVTFT